MVQINQKIFIQSEAIQSFKSVYTTYPTEGIFTFILIPKKIGIRVQFLSPYQKDICFLMMTSARQVNQLNQKITPNMVSTPSIKPIPYSRRSL